MLNCNVYIHVCFFSKIHIRTPCTHMIKYMSTHTAHSYTKKNDNMTIGLFYRIGGATTTIIVMRLPSLCQMNVWHTHTIEWKRMHRVKMAHLGFYDKKMRMKNMDIYFFLSFFSLLCSTSFSYCF